MNLDLIKNNTKWEDAANSINSNFNKTNLELTKIAASSVKHKGYFTTEAALLAAQPSPKVGDNAYVGATYPGVVYICNTAGMWTATTTVPSPPAVNISEYYKKVETDTLIDTVEENIASLETDLNNIDVIISGKSPVEGITWGNNINDVLVKNATKYAWLEILDSTLNINQICYFKLVYKDLGILQCFSYNDTFDGHLILTYSAGSALTGEREVVLNGYGAYLNKIKLHLIIDFDQLSGNIIMSNTLINLSLLNTSKHDQIRLDDRVTILERGDLYGKNILCLGDSTTEIKLNYKSYPDFISEKSGANVINGGIGGTLICARRPTVETPTTSLQAYAALDIVSLIQTLIISDKNATEWKRFYNAVQWVKTHDYDDNTETYNRLYNVDMNDIDAITIMGGTNDWWYFGQGFTMPSSTDIFRSEGALNQIITLLGSNYPRIKIYWLTPIVRWDPSNSGIRNDATWSDNLSNGSCTLSEFSDRLYAQVKKRHIPICDMYWSLGWNQQNFSSYFYSNDGTHPYKGLKDIGYKVAAFIKSNLTF